MGFLLFNALLRRKKNHIQIQSYDFECFFISGNPCENGLFPCENGGECYVLNVMPKCACLNGFSGVNCSCESIINDKDTDYII